MAARIVAYELDTCDLMSYVEARQGARRLTSPGALPSLKNMADDGDRRPTKTRWPARRDRQNESRRHLSRTSTVRFRRTRKIFRESPVTWLTSPVQRPSIRSKLSRAAVAPRRVNPRRRRQLEASWPSRWLFAASLLLAASSQALDLRGPDTARRTRTDDGRRNPRAASRSASQPDARLLGAGASGDRADQRDRCSSSCCRATRHATASAAATINRRSSA